MSAIAERRAADLSDARELREALELATETLTKVMNHGGYYHRREIPVSASVSRVELRCFVEEPPHGYRVRGERLDRMFSEILETGQTHLGWSNFHLEPLVRTQRLGPAPSRTLAAATTSVIRASVMTTRKRAPREIHRSRREWLRRWSRGTSLPEGQRAHYAVVRLVKKGVVKRKLAAYSWLVSATNPDGSAETVEGSVFPLPSSEHYHGPVWHFTDAYALVNIVAQQELWASAATMLNDPEELVYGATRIVDWYSKHGDGLPKDAALHLHLTNILKDEFIRRTQEKPAYVVCASKGYSVLNQWRNYGSTSGMSVRLEPHALLVPEGAGDADFVFLPQWVTVEYEPEAQDARIARVLSGIGTERLGNVLRWHPGEANLIIRGILASLAASMKDPAYAEEREVRLIVHLPDGHKPHHRGSSRGVIPFVKIVNKPMFGWELAGAGGQVGLPILEVRVGPPDGESEQQRIVGVESLLRAHGVEAPVNGSTIKYLPVQ